MEFLVGLNPEYDQERVQILGRERLPSLNEVFGVVHSEENMRVAMLGEIHSEGSTMLTNKGERIQSKSQLGRADEEGPQFKRGGKTDRQSWPQWKENLWCTYCKKPRHTHETYLKLHGKEAVLQKMGGFQNMPARNQAYLSNKQEEKVKKTDTANGMELNQLNQQA